MSLLRRGSRVRGRARQKLDALLASKLATARAWGEISTGAVESLNNKIRVVTRRSYGFRTFEAMAVAHYHTLGRLPESESAHRFR
jgi:transposase